MKNELKKIQEVVSPDYPECLESQSEDEELLDGEEEEQRRSSRDAFLKITLHFLRRMKQEELADRLQSSKRIFQTPLFSYFHLHPLTDLICCVFIQELLLQFVDVNSNLT